MFGELNIDMTLKVLENINNFFTYIGSPLANKITKPVNNENKIENNENLIKKTTSKPNNQRGTWKCDCFS